MFEGRKLAFDGDAHLGTDFDGYMTMFSVEAATWSKGRVIHIEV